MWHTVEETDNSLLSFRLCKQATWALEYINVIFQGYNLTINGALNNTTTNHRLQHFISAARAMLGTNVFFMSVHS